MKKLIVLTLACGLLLTLVATVASSAQTVGLRLNVPFSFNVDEKVLPPGDYVVLSPQAQRLTILGPDGAAALALVNQTSGKRPAADGALVFTCYGERCFLSQFWSARRDTGQQVLKSNFEKRLATQKEILAVITLRAKPYPE